MSDITAPSFLQEQTGRILPTSFAAWQHSRRQRERRGAALRWGLALLLTGTASAVIAAAVGWHPPPPPPPPESVGAAMTIDLAPPPVAAPAITQPAEPPSLPRPMPQIASSPKIPSPPVPVPRTQTRHIMKKDGKDKILPKQDRSEAASAARTTPLPADASSRSPSVADSPATWQGALLARLEKYKRYPETAQSDREEGTAMLRFSMDRTGRLLSAQIADSSGHPSLDQETLALVRHAAPFPPPPASVEGDPVTLTVPIAFFLAPATD